MKLPEELKKIYLYLRTNKIAAVILMVFVFLYLINQDIFLNAVYKRLAHNDAAVSKLKKEISAFKNTTGSLSNQQNTLLGIRKQIANLKSKLKNEEIMLPKTFMISDLIKNIALNKPADNFVIEKINLGKPVKYNGIMALPVSISITGGFNKSIEFIKNMNSMKRIFIINYVSVKASKKLFPDIESDIKGLVFSMNG
ncbi:MAG: type 4a pilus biogenesis protein PilO [bacterium]